MPPDTYCFPLNGTLINISVLPEPGIKGVIPIISHAEIMSFRNYIRSKAARCIQDIRLIQLDTIDIGDTINDLNRFPRQPYDSFCIFHIRRIRSREYDNIAPTISIYEDWPYCEKDAILFYCWSH